MNRWNWLSTTALMFSTLTFVSSVAGDEPMIRIGAWNIEWLGLPGNRTGSGKNVAQSPTLLADYIHASGVQILAIEEICDDDGITTMRSNRTLDAVMNELDARQSGNWKYVLFPKKNPADEIQHLGVAWNANAVSMSGSPFELPANTDSDTYNLLDRIPYAVKFVVGPGKTDLVIVPVHFKSNRGGMRRTESQRAEEAKRVLDVLGKVVEYHEDLDIVFLGDFNTLKGTEPGLRRFRDNGFVDLNSRDEKTMAKSNVPFDRILVPSAQHEFPHEPLVVFQLDSMDDSQHRELLSDHYMVVTSIKVLADDDSGANLSWDMPSISLTVDGGDSDVHPVSEGFPSIAKRYEVNGLDNPFELSQAYPTTYNPDERFPWEEIDFRTHPKLYMESVLSYCFEGNRPSNVDFVVQNNAKRQWYHAPWFHDDGVDNGAGREAYHGLTRERRSRPGELHANQKDFAQNWAIGFYNERGGYTLGKVWGDGSKPPNPFAANFPNQTVSFKLLFTDASVDQVPYLDKTKIWTANIYADTSYQGSRVDREIRLLQVDVAVKDPRVANSTGWIFGTFIYDASMPGEESLDRLAFVGLSWDDDVDVGIQLHDGAVDNGQLPSTTINHELLGIPRVEKQAKMLHLGLGGRLNGPVDNPLSSCISCHARAAVSIGNGGILDSQGKPMQMFNSGISSASQFTKAEFARFFRTIGPGPHLERDGNELFVTTDYSQQLAIGIRNYYTLSVKAASFSSDGKTSPTFDLPLGTRGEK